MDKLKQWVGLTLVAVLAVVAAGWFLLVSPTKSQAADLQSQADAQDATNDGLRTQLQVLKAKARELPKEKAKLAAVAAKIPATPAVPSLIRALSAAADASGVEFISLTKSGGAAPVGTTAGYASIPVTINVVGGYFEVEQFMAALENLPRALRVSQLAVTPGADPLAVKSAKSASSATNGSSLVTVITGEVFTSAAASLGSTTAGPVPVPAATTTGTATTTPTLAPKAPPTAN